MNRFVAAVARDLAGHDLLRDGQRVLVAVSGGADSVVLLDVLHRLSRRHRWRLTVAHFNHRLRGRQSDGDERFVRALAAGLGWPVVTGCASVRALARARRISIEMAAREARHAWLASVARECEADTIAMAHHADDQAELFLLRLLRGAGSVGLGGMRWTGPSPVEEGLRLIRPLLGRTRSEILSYAREGLLAYRQDASNESPEILRNRIRNELIPLLERKYQRGVRRLLVRQAELLGAEAAHVAEEAATWRRSGWRRKAFARLPRALQRRVIVSQLLEKQIVAEFDVVEALRSRAGKPVRAAGGWILVRDESGGIAANREAGHGKRSVRPPGRPGRRAAAGSSGGSPSSGGPVRRRFEPPAAGNEERLAPLRVELAANRGQFQWEGYRVQWRIRGGRAPDVRRLQANREWFDAEKVGPVIAVRGWRSGDRFQPLGLPRVARLQNLFVNARIPQESRRTRMVVTDARGTILWVDGLRIGEAAKVGPSTTRFLEWRWERPTELK